MEVLADGVKTPVKRSVSWDGWPPNTDALLAEVNFVGPADLHVVRVDVHELYRVSEMIGKVCDTYFKGRTPWIFSAETVRDLLNSSRVSKDVALRVFAAAGNLRCDLRPYLLPFLTLDVTLANAALTDEGGRSKPSMWDVAIELLHCAEQINRITVGLPPLPLEELTLRKAR